MKKLKGKDSYLINRMKSVFYFLLFTLVVSCTTSNTIYKQPEDLIPKDTMKMLLIDMYLANSSKNIKTKSSKKYKNLSPVIYKKYKIDSLRFDNSNIYYTSKIEDYNEILDVVKDSIEKKMNFYEKAIKIKDSIKRDKKDKRKKLKKQSDSLRKAQKEKGYVPALRFENKNDSIYFFDNSQFYNPKIDEYRFLLKGKQEKSVKKNNNKTSRANLRELNR